MYRIELNRWVLRALLPLLGVIALLTGNARAAQEVSVEIGDVEFTVERFGRSSDRLLWLPSEFGVRGPVERQHLRGIARLGLEGWLVDLHGGYFIAPGRSSYSKVPVADIAELIELARPASGRLYLLSTGRGAALLLEAARLWRLDHPAAPALGGVVLIHPNLASGIAAAGEAINYLPVSRATNLPIYILQPGDSAKRWYLRGLVEALEGSGSSVFLHPLKGVSDGFHLRPEASEHELLVRSQLARLVVGASHRLRRFNQSPRQAVAKLPEVEAKPSGVLHAGLQPITSKSPAPNLRLRDIAGGTKGLADYRGRVVLLNFWATWCPPCVKEIPSLGRLQGHFAKDKLTVLSVDVGESEMAVRNFLSRVPATFPVLLDPGGSSVHPWRIRAFPTTFVIDQQGRLRYGFYGALEWDSEQVVALLQKLVEG